MTCGITVAPRMPAPSRMLSVPSKRGINRPPATPDSEGHDDDTNQRGDDRLETPEAARLQGKNPERGEGRDDSGHEKRDGREQQVDSDRGADELREVGRLRSEE